MSAQVTRISIRRRNPSQKKVSPLAPSNVSTIPQVAKRRRPQAPAEPAAIVPDPPAADAVEARDSVVENVGQLIAKQLTSKLTDICKSEVKKVIEKKKLDFKYASNEWQHKFNGDILERLCKFPEGLGYSIDSQQLDDTIKDLESRQQDILIADSSINGWDVVAELHRERDGVKDAGVAKRAREVDEQLSRKRRGSQRAHAGFDYVSHRVGANDGFYEPHRRGGAAPWPRGESHRFDRGGSNGRKASVTPNQCRRCFAFAHWERQCPQGTSRSTGEQRQRFGDVASYRNDGARN